MIGPMNGNQIRDTPGRMLMLLAVCCLPLVVFAWRVHLGRGQFDWVEYPTALGDSSLYGDHAKLGENDFFEPNLKFEGHEKGLFRRSVNPKKRQDESMMKVAKESGGRFYVYTDAKNAEAKAAKAERILYLKAGDDRYIEFGARKYFQEYVAPGTVPSAVPVPVQ